MSKTAVIASCVLLVACSSTPKQEDKKGTALQPVTAGPRSKNPAAKYIELVGFRVKEKGPGKLEVLFGVVNHSEADLGDLKFEIGDYVGKAHCDYWERRRLRAAARATIFESQKYNQEFIEF